MAVKRHEIECPLKATNLAKPLIDMWENGWLDDFSDEHFLIRTIYGDKGIEEKLTQHYPAGATELYYMKNNVGLTFCMNLAMKIKAMSNVFGEKNIKKFVKNQLSAGKRHYNESTFFEALAEIEILCFFVQFGPGEATGYYEPRCGNGNCNPEASFTYTDGTRIDIEVKTPEFIGNYRGTADIYMPLHSLTKKGLDEFEKVCKKYYATFQRPRLSKLKSFIESACDKFEKPINEKHYNILFINWTYTEIPVRGYIEAVSLLSNPYNGIFLNRDMAEKVGISEELYTKITAIFVFQNPLESIVFQDLRYLYLSRQATLILNPFLLDTEEKRRRFHKDIQMFERDFIEEEIPELYYSVNGVHKSYITNQLRKIINENRVV